MSYYITEDFTDGLFDSCKNVQLTFTTDRAIGITCGGHNEDCTPHLWLEYMGTYGTSPYQIDFHFENSSFIEVNDTTFYPMNETIIPCSQPVSPGGAACSCVDCPCAPHPPYVPPKDDRKIFGLPRMLGIMLILYSILAVIIIGGFICYGSRKKDDGKYNIYLFFLKMYLI